MYDPNEEPASEAPSDGEPTQGAKAGKGKGKGKGGKMGGGKGC